MAEDITAALPPSDQAPSMLNRGKTPTTAWLYRDETGAPLFWIARYDDGDKKTFAPWSWTAIGWVQKAWPKPRPLYGLWKMAFGYKAILVVEGEKTADAAQVLLPEFDVITWPGGAAGALSADWRPLRGRDVTIWPDADDPGRKAAFNIADELSKYGPVKIVQLPDSLEKGWDLADTDDPALALSILSKTVRIEKQAPAAKTGLVEAKAFPGLPEGKLDVLESMGVSMTRQGSVVTNLDNVTKVLDGWKGFGDLAWYDEFHGRIFTNFQGETREWSDNDTFLLTRFLQREFSMQKAAVETVRQALSLYAHAHKRNEPRDWMDGLAWDGKERISSFLPVYFQANDDEYTRAAGRNWWLSLAARIYSPGCKVDTMLILQGEQGRGKSSAFELIGGKWYGIATAPAEDAKAFGETLQGKLIMEMAELVNFTKADAEAVKRLLSTPSDRYRASYGYFAQDRPRQGVLVGTTNKDSFLQDETGARRFHPVKIHRTNLAGLARDREQLFAEAVHAFKAWQDSSGPGHLGRVDALGWWLMPALAEEIQELARQHDEIEGEIADYLEQHPNGVTLSEIWTDCMSRGLKDFERGHQLRVGKILRVLRWAQTTRPEKVDGRTVRMWRPIDPPF